jgi:uncharacterized protein involved in exopolysaccharide biosynthesis
MNEDETPPFELPASGLMQAWLLPYQPKTAHPSGLTLLDYFREARRLWVVPLLSMLVLTAASVAVALLSTQVWRANVLVMIRPQSGSDGLGRSLITQLGGLSSIAELAGAGSSGDAEAFAVLQSRETTEKFIETGNLLPLLFYKDWDAQQGKWKPLTDGPPTIADGYRYFTRKVINVSQDRKTGMVSLTIDWRDRQLAALWANSFVKFADEVLRNRTMEESRITIDYLDTQLKSEESVPIRESLFKTLESQQKTLVFAKTRREFAFRVIDPAVVPEIRDRIWPKRRLLVLVGAAGGFLAGFGIIVLRLYLRNSKHVIESNSAYP